MTELTIIPSGKLMEDKIGIMSKIKADLENWEVYYLDEKTGEKWVKEYPFSEAQAGGPPQLRLIKNFPWESAST